MERTTLWGEARRNAGIPSAAASVPECRWTLGSLHHAGTDTPVLPAEMAWTEWRGYLVLAATQGSHRW